MDLFTIVYLVGMAVALGASVACVKSFKYKFTPIIILLCIGTAILSWIGLGVLYGTFFNGDNE